MLRVDTHERFFLRNGSLIDHVHRDFYRGGRGALPVSGLQHVQLAALDGELEVLHVAIVKLHATSDVLELLVGGRHISVEGTNGLRGANAGNHVFALRVQKIFAEKLRLSG